MEWLMPFLHAAFCFGHGAFAVWSCGVLKSSCGVSLSVMGRFAAGPGGRASSLPAMVWCHRTYGHLTLVPKVTWPSKTTFTKRLEANPSAQMVVYLDCALGFTQKTGYMYLFKVIYLYKYIIIHWIQKSKYTRRCALGCALGFAEK